MSSFEEYWAKIRKFQKAVRDFQAGFGTGKSKIDAHIDYLIGRKPPPTSKPVCPDCGTKLIAVAGGWLCPKCASEEE